MISVAHSPLPPPSSLSFALSRSASPISAFVSLLAPLRLLRSAPPVVIARHHMSSVQRTPSDFLKEALGRPVSVRLNSGDDYKGPSCGRRRERERFARRCVKARARRRAEGRQAPAAFFLALQPASPTHLTAPLPAFLSSSFQACWHAWTVT